MNRQKGNRGFDAIVIGSGAGGATVARELSKRGHSVLILERGGNTTLKDGVFSTVSVLNAVSLGDNIVMGRALTTGGTTAVYLAATTNPRLESFLSLGIDLSKELTDTEKELPLAALPDALLPPQSLKLRESANALGYKCFTSRMLIDQTRCNPHYAHDAKWTARNYVQEAVEKGAVLVNQASVLRILVEKDCAIGVEYEVRKTKENVEVRQAFGSKIVLAAGGAATPIILRNSGLRNVADKGFYCHPGFMLFGTISGMKRKNGFGGSWGLLVDEGVRVGDANFNRTFHRLVMLGQRQWLRAFLPSRSIGMGVVVRDGLGGELHEDGRYYKQLTNEDLAKLAKGEDAARRVIEHAGGRNVLKSTMSASHLGGTIRIKEHVDEKLETEFRNLHVCDGSVLPGEVATPTLTLICLGKYLANHLAGRAPCCRGGL